MSNANFTISFLLKAIDEATGPLRQTIGCIKDLKGAASSASSPIGHVTSQASQSFAMFGLALEGAQKAWSLVTAPLRMLNEAIVEPTARYEMFQARLETTEKSAEAAAKSFEWIKDFAEKTPYNLDTVMNAFTRLRAFGLNPMDETLRKLGNAAAMAGGASPDSLMGVITAFGQSFAKTKLQTEEMNQLLERGVPAWDLLSNALHKPIPELMDLASKGKLGRDAIRALIDEAGRASAGGMDRASQTFDGLTSTLGDLWEQVRVGIGQGGLIDYLKQGLRSVNETLMAMNASGELPQLSRELGTAFTGAARAVVEVMPDVRSAFGMLVEVFAIIRREVKLAISDWDQFVGALERLWAQVVPILNAVRSAENVIRGVFGAQQLAPYAMPELPSPAGGGGGPRRGGARGVFGGRGADDLAGGSGGDRLLPARYASPAVPATGTVVLRFENSPPELRVRRIESDGIDLLADLGWVMR